jgi:hypothetical protein
VRKTRGDTIVDLELRYPLMGGWKVDFNLGYSLPLQVRSRPLLGQLPGAAAAVCTNSAQPRRPTFPALAHVSAQPPSRPRPPPPHPSCRASCTSCPAGGATWRSPSPRPWTTCTSTSWRCAWCCRRAHRASCPCCPSTRTRRPTPSTPTWTPPGARWSCSASPTWCPSTTSTWWWTTGGGAPPLWCQARCLDPAGRGGLLLGAVQAAATQVVFQGCLSQPGARRRQSSRVASAAAHASPPNSHTAQLLGAGRVARARHAGGCLRGLLHVHHRVQPH